MYKADAAGIFVGSGPTPTLSVLVSANVIHAGSESEGIGAQSVSGQVRGNDISNAAVGIFDAAPALKVTGNTIFASGFGMFRVDGGTAEQQQCFRLEHRSASGGGATLSGTSIISIIGPASTWAA